MGLLSGKTALVTGAARGIRRFCRRIDSTRCRRRRPWIFVPRPRRTASQDGGKSLFYRRSHRFFWASQKSRPPSDGGPCFRAVCQIPFCSALCCSSNFPPPNNQLCALYLACYVLTASFCTFCRAKRNWNSISISFLYFKSVFCVCQVLFIRKNLELQRR